MYCHSILALTGLKYWIDGQDPKEQSNIISFGYGLFLSCVNIFNDDIGQLKAKLAKLKRELLTPSSSGGGGGGESCHKGINLWSHTDVQ